MHPLLFELHNRMAELQGRVSVLKKKKNPVLYHGIYKRVLELHPYRAEFIVVVAFNQYPVNRQWMEINED